MKKLVLGLLVAVFVVAGSSSTASALAPTTVVTGVVTKNQAAVPGAVVTVECMGHTRTDTTDAHGSYLVGFPAGDCPFGSTVKVTAVKAGESGVASGTVEGKTTKLNLALVNVAIPEYGLISALAAGSLGIGMIIFNRRRQTQAQL